MADTSRRVGAYGRAQLKLMHAQAAAHHEWAHELHDAAVERQQWITAMARGHRLDTVADHAAGAALAASERARASGERALIARLRSDLA